MHRKDLRIGIISDSRNQMIADTYLSLLKTSSFASSFYNYIHFNPRMPERTTELMEKHHVIIAQIGVPGAADYQNHIDHFLEAFAAVKRKPPTGLVTHDAEHTRFVINNWLSGASRAHRDLPDGILSIIDARNPLRATGIEKTLEILSSHAATTPAARGRAIPFSKVQPTFFHFNHRLTETQ